MRLQHRHDGATFLNASSMADIAFLMLTFFMVTTVIKHEKGLLLLLPPYQKDGAVEEIHDRNLFTVHINSYDQFLVEGERRRDVIGLREEIKKFILNNGRDINLSESPQKAIVSLKADRGTTHKVFIHALDEIQAAYIELYAGRCGLSPDAFRDLHLQDPIQFERYQKARDGIPMNISIAEPR